MIGWGIGQAITVQSNQGICSHWLQEFPPVKKYLGPCGALQAHEYKIVVKLLTIAWALKELTRQLLVCRRVCEV